MGDLTINGYAIIYIPWNFILGILPFFLCYLVFKKTWLTGYMEVFYRFFWFFIWLLFIPNTAYIITDVRHINGFCSTNYHNICPENAWMIVFFFVYGLIGWILYYYTLEQMLYYLRTKFSEKISFIFTLLIIPTISLGILLGLINRLNSWDIFKRFETVIESALFYFTKIEAIALLIAYSLSLYGLYYLGKFILKPIESVKILKKFLKK
jgi:uncharacterized membrane protein